MNNQLRSLNELRKFGSDFFEGGLPGEKFERDAVHLQCAGVNVALRVDVLMVVTACDATIDHLDAANLNNPMALINLKPRGLCIQHNLASIHGAHSAICLIPDWPMYRPFHSLDDHCAPSPSTIRYGGVSSAHRDVSINPGF